MPKRTSKGKSLPPITLIPNTWDVNHEADMPVYEQIKDRIYRGLVSGEFKPCDQLPSVRELAATVGVNANTVTKVFRDLEFLDVVVSTRGVGVFFTLGAVGKAKSHVLSRMNAHIDGLVDALVAMGFSDKELATFVRVNLRAKVASHPLRVDTKKRVLKEKKQANATLLFSERNTAQ